MATKLAADEIAKLDPYKFMAVIGKRVPSFNTTGNRRLTWLLSQCLELANRLLTDAPGGARATILKGTTIGGIICGLKVVRIDDRPLDWPTCIVRALGCFLSMAVMGLGFFWVVLDPDRHVPGVCDSSPTSRPGRQPGGRTSWPTSARRSPRPGRGPPGPRCRSWSGPRPGHLP